MQLHMSGQVYIIIYVEGELICLSPTLLAVQWF